MKTSAGSSDFPAESVDNLGFVEHKIDGIILEVTAKYVAPIIYVGRGSSGVVCSALDSTTRKRVAIKKLGKAFDVKTAMRTLRLVKLLSQFKHENIIPLLDIIPIGSRDLYIVLELQRSDLERPILDGVPLISGEGCRVFLYQFLRALKYIHSANVLHRYLKPANILVDDEGNMRISGFAYAGPPFEPVLFVSELDIQSYCAPELLVGSSEPTTAIDVWSAGCIFIESLSGTTLFPRGASQAYLLNTIVQFVGIPGASDEDENGRRRRIREFLGPKFEDTDPKAIDLVIMMLTLDPSQRITVEDALAHEYLRSVRRINEEPICSSSLIFNFEEQEELNEEQIKEFVNQEALKFNPGFPQELE